VFFLVQPVQFTSMIHSKPLGPYIAWAKQVSYCRPIFYIFAKYWPIFTGFFTSRYWKKLAI